jgi:cytochrome P450
MSGAHEADQQALEVAATFDHWSPELAVDPFPTYQTLRQHCPVARSEEYGGFWVLSRYDDVLASLRDPSTFSSSVMLIPPQDPETMVKVPPLDLDPPAHTAYRQLLLPYFSPNRVAKLEPFTRSTARREAEKLAKQKTAEVVRPYAFRVPMLVIAEILGVDASDSEMFGQWITKIVEEGGIDPEGAVEANRQIHAYLQTLLDARRKQPSDDLLSFLLEARLDGSPLSDTDRLGIATLLLIAGIDTTANTLAASLWYLAQDVEMQKTFRAEPARIQTAVEEFLRFFTPVSISRIITCPAQVGGTTMPADDQVLLSLPSANRDEAKFDRADAIDPERLPNPHLAFGGGIHRCLGQHIARSEMRVCLEEFLAAVPPFRLSESGAATTMWKSGPIRGPRSVTLAFEGP